MRVLINAANLHSGGAVQVAASFVDELDALLDDPDAVLRWPWIQSVSLLLSDQVRANLSREVRLATVSKTPSRRSVDVAFTVFGPTYRLRTYRRNLMGFADVTLIYPEIASSLVPLRTRIKRRLRAPIAIHSFRSADILVMETKAAQERASAYFDFPRERTSVVANSVNAAMLPSSVKEWAPPTRPKDDRTSIHFCFVSRAYPHKNLNFIGPFCAELGKLGIDARVYTTLSTSEWGTIDEQTQGYCSNLGPVTVSEARAVYEASDAALFPSLLECFSATPLEAMAMGLPLFASDRDFVRSTCGDSPFYIDPENPASSSAVVREAWDNPSEIARKVDEGRRLIAKLPGPRDRAMSYLSLIQELLDAD